MQNQDIYEVVELSPKREARATRSASSKSIDLQDYLIQLHCTVLALRYPNLVGIDEKLQKAIDEIPANSQRIQLDDVAFSLETIFRFLTAPPNDSEDVVAVDELISVHVTLRLLLFLVYQLDASNNEPMNELQEKIEAAVDDGNSEKSVPIERLQLALEASLRLIGI